MRTSSSLPAAPARLLRLRSAVQGTAEQNRIQQGRRRRRDRRTRAAGRASCSGVVFQPDVPLGLSSRTCPSPSSPRWTRCSAALRAYLDGIFDDKVFVVSFVSNVVIAAGIVYLGDKLGVGGQLSTGVIVVLGIRIFSNVAAIRRHLFHA